MMKCCEMREGYGVVGMVKEVRVLITDERFNNNFECAPDEYENEDGHVDDYRAFINTSDYEKVLEKKYFLDGHGFMSMKPYSKITTRAKRMNAIIHNRLFPSSNSRKTIPERTAFAYCIEQEGI